MCHSDNEDNGFYTMIDDHLEVPFQTEVLGVDVTVTGVDLGNDDQIVAICAHRRWRQRIPILDLPLPAPSPGPLLVQAGELAKLEGGQLQLTAKGRTALRKPPAEVIRQLWQRWLTHALIDEFTRIEEIKGQCARNVLTSAKARRHTVATALTSCSLHR